MTIANDTALLAVLEEKIGASKDILATIHENVEADCINYSASSTDAISALDAFLFSMSIVAEKDAHSLKIRL